MVMWKIFDSEWYIKKYKNDHSLSARDQDIVEVENYYNQEGYLLGHSPNPYFSEKWYVGNYPDVQEAIKEGRFKSGFEHYCVEGYKNKNPHWLFDEALYLTRYGNFKKEFLNGYDQYLSSGDLNLESGSWFFNPELYQNQGVVKNAELKYGLFKSLLKYHDDYPSLYRTSWFFDPIWYQSQYPEVVAEIKEKKWDSYLHHYLCNDTPTKYDPNQYFSEDFYLMNNPDVARVVAEKYLRNGYEHFLKDGALERRLPSSELDINSIFIHSLQIQYEVKEKIYANAFEAIMALPDKNRLLQNEEKLEVAESVTRRLFIKNSRNRVFPFYKNKLDFSYTDPKLTIIIVAHNNFDFTFSTLLSVKENFSGEVQIIFVDSGSKDSVKEIEKYVKGMDVIRFKKNVGFLYSCNAALEKICSSSVLFLNNDIMLLPRAIDNALSRLWSSHSVGAVGGKIIRTNGLLQEAGCIMWRDGVVQGYMRDADPLLPEVNFVRSVDFCSGVFLMVKRDLLQEIKGFDEDYAPAYFEETDMCVRIKNLGYEIIYDHAVSIIHYEYGTSNQESANRLIMKNQILFAKKNSGYLQTRLIRNGNLITKARTADLNKINILFVEDRLPFKHIGSGFSRSLDIIQAMSELGYQVTVYPVYKAIEHLEEIYSEFPDTVEVIYDRELQDLEYFLNSRPNYFNVIWIARTHNAGRVGEIIGRCAHIIPADHIILDTEAIASTRTELKEKVFSQVSTSTLEEKMQEEFRYANIANALVAVNKKETDILREVGFKKVYTLGHSQKLQETKASFSERKGILFVGAIHDVLSPNLDALSWFTTQVLPILSTRLPEDCLFAFAGYTKENIDLTLLKSNTKVEFLGQVSDLEPIYNKYRVFVVPTRYASGIPYKIHEAASHGIPIVASNLICEQIAWECGKDILCGDTNNPQDFSDKICSLYFNEELWNSVRQSELERMRIDHNKEVYSHAIKEIINDILK